MFECKALVIFYIIVLAGNRLCETADPADELSALGTPVTNVAAEPTMKLLNKYFLNFGNYEEGIGTPCDYEFETIFFNSFTKKNKSDFLEKTWNHELMIEDLQHVCNRFKYLRCDRFTERCVCGVQHTFWSPSNESYSKVMKGKCRIRLGIKNLCDNNGTDVLLAFKQPFTSQVLPVEFHQALTPEPIVNSTCALNQGRQYICKDPEGKDCKTGRMVLEQEFQKLRKTVDDSSWNFQPNYVCNSSLIYELTRGGATEFGHDFERIRKAIKANQTTQFCNPLAYKECRYGVCDCPTGRGGATDYNLVNNKCVVGEGGVCSRFYWFNGNWEIKFQSCSEGLHCRGVDNNERDDFICCDPEKDKGSADEGLGKCKFLLSGRRGGKKETQNGAAAQFQSSTFQLQLLIKLLFLLQLL